MSGSAAPVSTRKTGSVTAAKRPTEDTNALRSAVAEEDGTAILCLGGTPGEAFEVSAWEREYDRPRS